MGSSLSRRRRGRPTFRCTSHCTRNRTTHSPLLVIDVHQLAPSEPVFEAISELEIDQTANLAAEAGHDQWAHPAGADAVPVLELEFDQILGL